MNQINYDAMTDEELKRHFLLSRDRESFQAYMDRRYAKPRQVLIEASELEELPFDEQVKLIDERMRSQFGDVLESGNE